MLVELKKRTFVETMNFKFNSLVMMLYDSIKTVRTVKTFADQSEDADQSKTIESSIEINFKLIDELIFHFKEKSRICISTFIEKKVFVIAHDDNSHVGQHRVYQRLLNFVYMLRMSRKLHMYIKHCSSCQLNQTKRHRSYEKLKPLSTSDLSFHTLIMNFVVALFDEYDALLTIICKFFRKLMLIVEKITHTATQ